MYAFPISAKNAKIKHIRKGIWRAAAAGNKMRFCIFYNHFYVYVSIIQP
jgi:hypothetical protein